MKKICMGIGEKQDMSFKVVSLKLDVAYNFGRG